MKKNLLLISLVVLLLVVLGLVYYILTKGSETPPATQKVEDVSVAGVGTPADRELFSGVGTLQDLQQRNEDLECQVKYKTTEQESEVEGTYFVSKGMVRGDFVTPTKDLGNVISSIVIDRTTLYVWSKIGVDSFGVKAPKAMATVDSVDMKEPVPLDAEVKFTCARWLTVDGSVFVPPSEVNFTDASNAVKSGMEYPN